MAGSIAIPTKVSALKLWLTPSSGLLAAALVSATVMVFSPVAETRAGACIAALTFCFLILGLKARKWLEARDLSQSCKVLRCVIGKDPTPCILTDDQGTIICQNEAAQGRYQVADGVPLAMALKLHFASPAEVVLRLLSQSVRAGSVQEQVVSAGRDLRLSALQLTPEKVLWRFDEIASDTLSTESYGALTLPILTANADGSVQTANAAMVQMLGYMPTHLDQVFDLPNPISGEELDVLAQQGPIRATLLELAGPQGQREIYLLPPGSGKDAVPSLAEFETVPVPLVKFSAKGKLIVANASARGLLREPVAKSLMFHDLFEGLGRPVADWLDDIAQDRSPSRSEVLRARGLEGEVFLQVTLRRFTENGQRGVLAVLQDATALKTLEAQFAQSQKMQAIGQLAGGVAHDFNNLLTAISGHCDLLLLRHSREDFDYPDLVQIHQNANRAAALVGQLLAFSRKQTLKPERLDVAEILSDLAHLLNRLVGEKVQLQLCHALCLGSIRADKRQLEQVLINLVVNARDAMPGGGAIRITSESVSLRAPLERDNATVPAGDYAVIHVADTGTGIPADLLTKIFEPFYTTKKLGEGTGLGLSTAYGIVKQSGGFNFVDSQLGQGTTFHLYFPLHSGPIEGAEPPLVKKPLLRQGEGVVLLVEDEAPVRAFASRALRLRGYTVLEASTAEDALTTLADPYLQVDLFVTDVVMPGLDGPSWVTRALQDRPYVKVIFMSGYAEEALSETQARIPNSVFLAKPFSLSDLTATVQAQLQ